MIGRVNTGGGKMKSIIGTFTSNKYAAQCPIILQRDRAKIQT